MYTLKSQNKFFLVALLLLTYLLTMPFLQLLKVHNEIYISLSFSALLLFSLYAISHHKQLARVNFIIALAAIGFRMIYHGNQTTLYLELSYAFSVLFAVLLITLVFLEIFNTQNPITEKIFAAIAVYLLLGICWGLFYNLMEYLYPGTFHMSNLVGSHHETRKFFESPILSAESSI